MTLFIKMVLVTGAAYSFPFYGDYRQCESKIKMERILHPEIEEITCELTVTDTGADTK